MRQRSIHSLWRCAAVLIWMTAVAGCGSPHTVTTDNLRTGQEFPVLSVQDLEGRPVALAAAPGKLVVLNVWATWCAACRKELPSLQRLSRALDARRFEVVGLSLDDDNHVVREYLIDLGVSFANFMDPELEVADNVLGVKVYPYTFFIGPDGEMLGRVIGTAEWDDARVIAALEAAYRGDREPLAALSRR